MTERQRARRGSRRDPEEIEAQEEEAEPDEVSVPVGKPDHFGVHREWDSVPRDAAQDWDDRQWTRRRVWPK